MSGSGGAEMESGGSHSGRRLRSSSKQEERRTTQSQHFTKHTTAAPALCAQAGLPCSRRLGDRKELGQTRKFINQAMALNALSTLHTLSHVQILAAPVSMALLLGRTRIEAAAELPMVPVGAGLGAEHINNCCRICPRARATRATP